MSSVDELFGSLSEEDQKKAEAASREASTEEALGSTVKISGSYRMRVVEKKFTDKSGEIQTFPSIIKTKNGALQLQIILETIDDVKGVPRGSVYYERVTMTPVAGSDDEAYAKTASMAKPRIFALLGGKVEDIVFAAGFVKENLCAEFSSVEDGFKLVKNSNMSGSIVYVVLEDDMYNGKHKLKVSRISIATDDMKSVSNFIEDDISSGGEMSDEEQANIAASISMPGGDDLPF